MIMKECFCDICFDQEKFSISINGIKDCLFAIDYSRDIDLTDLVILLCEKIECEQMFVLKFDTKVLNKKEELIKYALKQIFECFNLCIKDNVSTD